MGPGVGMGSMWLWWLLIVVGVAALVAGLVFGLTRAGRPTGTGAGDTTPSVSTARQILDERLARGEIDEEEYRVRRKALDG